MKNFSAENPIDKIDFLIKRLVDFSNENEFDFAIYKAFANESSITFNRYFAQINNELDKEKIISDLKTDFHFSIDDIVTNMMTTKKSVDNFETGVTYYIAQPTPDNRIRGYESNYKQLINFFLNSVEFGTTRPTVSAPENNLNKTVDKVEFSFNNEFDNVNSKVVFDYFKKELVDKNYLSLEDLENYLDLSFEKRELPKAKFIFKQNRTLKVIRVIFYNYFKNIAYKPNGKQSEYVKLLTDYFQGFEYEKVKNNFNK
ncbi:hypothetical protein ABF190_001700 [Flavobacterium psychrophilum]|uniref:hypothetical protein n=1 Tax=Flavobacterium psychrophilum TaxID=96345 RepID=UPI000B7C47BA|nr:hypothetical protein [Flavobacterium psychrophilum]SNB09801.1 hypothetical protein FPC831_670020 [Flavobacterium psychrophilum]